MNTSVFYKYSIINYNLHLFLTFHLHLSPILILTVFLPACQLWH